MDENTQTLVDILQSAGHEPYAYSGRGMYGKECVGVDVDREMLSFAADVIEALAICGEADEHGEMVAKAFRGARSDSMGRGTVVYFPRFAMSDEQS